MVVLEFGNSSTWALKAREPPADSFEEKEKRKKAGLVSLRKVLAADKPSGVANDGRTEVGGAATSTNRNFAPRSAWPEAPLWGFEVLAAVWLACSLLVVIRVGVLLGGTSRWDLWWLLLLCALVALASTAFAVWWGLKIRDKRATTSGVAHRVAAAETAELTTNSKVEPTPTPV